jgi:hypothetical protein
MVSVVNGLTVVPPASRHASCDSDTGRLFFFLTHSWGGGAAAAFAYEEAEVTLRSLDAAAEVVATASLAPAEWAFFSDLGRRAYRLEATGDVAVWAGDLQGGEAIDFIGDDFSTNLGEAGLDVVFHSQSHGATIFATRDGTTVRFDGTDHPLDTGAWIEVEPERGGRVASDAPVLVITFGGNTLDDWGGFLRPAPRRPPEEACPRLEPVVPDAGGDADADADADGDVEAEPAADLEDDADVQTGGSVDGDAESIGWDAPRPSCDCMAAPPPPRAGALPRLVLRAVLALT